MESTHIHALHERQDQSVTEVEGNLVAMTFSILLICLLIMIQMSSLLFCVMTYRHECSHFLCPSLPPPPRRSEITKKQKKM